MDKIIEILKINWVHQLIGFACFVAGAILGAFIVSILWKKFASKQRVKNKEIKDVDYITQNAISVYQNGKSKLEIAKISYICEAITYLLDKIPLEYGNSKLYDVLKKEDFKIANKELLMSDLSLHLDFTVYELLGFTSCLAAELKGEVYSFLDSRLGKFAWGVGKAVLKNKISKEDKTKHLDDITISALVHVVAELLKEPKEESKSKGFFKSIIDAAKGAALGFANNQVDVYVKEVIEIFANELNKLYSGQLKEASIKDLSMTSIGEGV